MYPTFTGSAYDLSVDKGILPGLLASRLGWEVTIASAQPASLPAGLRGIHFGDGALASLNCIWRQAPSVDVLHLTHLNWKTVVRALVYRLRNRRGVCFVRLGGHFRAGELQRLKSSVLRRAVFRFGLGLMDLVTGESSEALERFAAFAAQCRPRRVPATMLVPSCGFDLDRVVPRMDASRGIGPDILFVGRVGAPIKATDILLEAFRRLREDLHVQAQLRLIGPVQPAFERVLSDWREAATPATRAALTVAGPIWDRAALIDAYLQAKAFVICSYAEGGPNVFVEAASCGCLLVGTPVGQVRDVLAAAGCGWEVPAGDPQALAEALQAAISRPDAWERRLQRMERFAGQYSWPAVIDRLATTLQTLLRQKDVGRSA